MSFLYLLCEVRFPRTWVRSRGKLFEQRDTAEVTFNSEEFVWDIVYLTEEKSPVLLSHIYIGSLLVLQGDTGNNK